METGAVVANVDVWAVLLAAISTFVLGGLWYGPLFGKAWMRASGMTEEKSRAANTGLVFGVSFGLQLVSALVLSMLIGPEADVIFGLMAGGAVGVAWVAPALGVVYLFEQRSLVHWAINAGYHVISFLIMGAILGAWH